MKNINGIVISKEIGTLIYLKKYKYNTNFYFNKNQYNLPENYIDYNTWSQKN